MKNKIGAYIAYLKYLWRSSDQHSVHSPFVFELLTKCIHKVPKGSKTSAYNQAIKAYLEKNPSDRSFVSEVNQIIRDMKDKGELQNILILTTLRDAE